MTAARNASTTSLALLASGLTLDVQVDHIRGPASAPVTLLEYGDFQCLYCGQAESVIRELLAGHGDLRYVWRHLPLTEVHPQAQLSAEATEAAAHEGRFWDMHDTLLRHQDALTAPDLLRYAADLGLGIQPARETSPAPVKPGYHRSALASAYSC